MNLGTVVLSFLSHLVTIPVLTRGMLYVINQLVKDSKIFPFIIPLQRTNQRLQELRTLVPLTPVSEGPARQTNTALNVNALLVTLDNFVNNVRSTWVPYYFVIDTNSVGEKVLYSYYLSLKRSREFAP